MAFLSIKERIERRLCDVLREIDGIGSVQRWNANARQNSDHLSCYVINQDEVYDEATDTSGKYVVRATMTVELLYAQPGSDTTPSAQLHNEWMAKIYNAIMADPYLTDPNTGEALAIDTRLESVSNPQAERGQPEFFTILNFEVVYEVSRDSAFTAPAIGARES